MVTTKIKVSELAGFDAAEFLHGEEDILAYLTAVLEEKDASLLAAALGDVSRAHGMSQIGWDSGMTAVGLFKLLSIAQEIVCDSTAPDAEGFDTVKWLVQWIGRSQPALGGCKPVELLDTPAGLEKVIRLLGAVPSGAYL